MALIGLKRASELTGKNQSTIHRAMKNGRISYSTNESGERLIDTSELDRVFPIIPQANDDAIARKNAPELQRNDMQVAELRAELEIERAKSASLRDKVAALDADKADLREDRDRWRAQAEASNRLLTDQRAKQEQPDPYLQTLDQMAKQLEDMQRRFDEERAKPPEPVREARRRRWMVFRRP